MIDFLKNYLKAFSFVGLVFAALFFAASVTPSLLPRPYFVQGILSGFALAVGYALGVAIVGIWLFLELPQPGEKLLFWSKRISSAAVAVFLCYFVWRTSEWQNSIRELMQMPPVETAYPMRFFLIAILIACGLLFLGRLILNSGIVLGRRLKRYLPPRIAYAVSAVVVATAVFFIANGVIAKAAIDVADAFFLHADQLIDYGIDQPVDAMACGSPESLVDWQDIGRFGKEFVVAGPSKESIRQLETESGVQGAAGQVLQPIRVYVGMNSGEQEQQRARLAVDELKRVGGFDRSILIISTPTGTGWLDPGAVDTVEHLHRGDTAMVSMQYSYLPSWITILIDPTRSIRSAQALFTEVYDHWRTLPKDGRPRLYLHGLSLGSLGSESSTDLLTVFEDPPQGALWSGPPFPSRQHSTIVSRRNADSTAWMPRFRDERIVRFTAQENQLDPDKPWGPIRNVYIQYASDPMIWFSPNLAWHRPAWLTEPRGPDVSPQLGWYPIVTFLQIAFDLPMATSIPVGFGHNYSPSSYIDGWIAVTEPDNWTAEQTQQLKDYFEPRSTDSSASD